MTFAHKSSQSRNRRVSNGRRRRQQHLLDVKVRSRRATQHRIRRALVVFCRVVLLAGVCGAAYVGVREGARRLFFENPDYQLKTIEVQADGTLQRDHILSVADLHEGENIFNVNLARVRDRIQELPQVDDAQVVRKLPGEIDIRIVERKPIAWLTSDKEISDPSVSDAAFLVDTRGVLMRQKKLLPEYLGLPLILGCSSELLQEGKVVKSPEVKTALELLRLSARSFVQMSFQIREIDVSKGYCLLVTDNNHARVTFGLKDLEIQLQRLEQFLVYCDNSKQELETVNLLVQRNIPVTFAAPPPVVTNDTMEPAVEPRTLKAIPVHSSAKTPPPSKAGTRSAPIAKTIRSSDKERTNNNGEQ